MIDQASAKNENRADFLDDPLAIAIAVFLDRVKRLEEEDRSDLYELSKALFLVETQEEEQAAALAMREILEQAPAKVRPMILPSQPSDKLDGWLSFVSERIKTARETAGLTQKQLADCSGIPQSHISRLERKKHSPSSKTLEKLAKSLDIDVAFFDPSA